MMRIIGDKSAKNMCQHGIAEKFKQNTTLGETLLKTGDKKLVECSFDKLWGTGIALSNRNRLDKRLWVNDGVFVEHATCAPLQQKRVYSCQKIYVSKFLSRNYRTQH